MSWTGSLTLRRVRPPQGTVREAAPASAAPPRRAAPPGPPLAAPPAGAGPPADLA